MNIIIDFMYRIYMPVDLVLAISHSRLMRQRDLNKRAIEEKKVKHKIADNTIHYEVSEGIFEKKKQQTCLEIFRVW
jgi:hypothetical protein